MARPRKVVPTTAMAADPATAVVVEVKKTVARRGRPRKPRAEASSPADNAVNDSASEMPAVSRGRGGRGRGRSRGATSAATRKSLHAEEAGHGGRGRGRPRGRPPGPGRGPRRGPGRGTRRGPGRPPATARSSSDSSASRAGHSTDDGKTGSVKKSNRAGGRKRPATAEEENTREDAASQADSHSSATSSSRPSISDAPSGAMSPASGSVASGSGGNSSSTSSSVATPPHEPEHGEEGDGGPEAVARLIAALFGWRVGRLSTRDGLLRIALIHGINPLCSVSLEVPMRSAPSLTTTAQPADRRASSASTPSASSPTGAPSALSSNARVVSVNDGTVHMTWRECALWLSSQFNSGFAFGAALAAVPAVAATATATATAAAALPPPPPSSSTPSLALAPQQSHNHHGHSQRTGKGKNQAGNTGRRRSNVGSSRKIKESVSEESESNEEGEEEQDEARAHDKSAQAPRPTRKRGRPRKEVLARERPPTPTSTTTTTASTTTSTTTSSTTDTTSSSDTTSSTHTSPGVESLTAPPHPEPPHPEPPHLEHGNKQPTHQWEHTSSTSSVTGGTEEEDVDHLELLPRRRRARRESTPTPDAVAAVTVAVADDGPQAADDALPAPPATTADGKTHAAMDAVKPEAKAESKAGVAEEEVWPFAVLPTHSAVAPSVNSTTPSPSKKVAFPAAPAPFVIPANGAGHGLQPIIATETGLASCLPVSLARHGGGDGPKKGYGSAAAFLAHSRAESKRIAVELAAAAAAVVPSAKAGKGASPGLVAGRELLARMQALHDGESEVRADMKLSVQQALATAGMSGDPAHACVHALQTAASEERRWTRTTALDGPACGGGGGEVVVAGRPAPAFPREVPHAFLPASGPTLIQAWDRLSSAIAHDTQLRQEQSEKQEQQQEQRSEDESDGEAGKNKHRNQPSRYRVLPAGSVMPLAPRIEIGSTYKERGSFTVLAPVAGAVAGGGGGEGNGSPQLALLPMLVPNPTADVQDMIYRRFLPKDMKERPEHGSDTATNSGMATEATLGKGESEGSMLEGTVSRATTTTANIRSDTTGNAQNGCGKEREEAALAGTSGRGSPERAAPAYVPADIDTTLKREDKRIGRVPMADVEWRYQA